MALQHAGAYSKELVRHTHMHMHYLRFYGTQAHALIRLYMFFVVIVIMLDAGISTKAVYKHVRTL